MEYRYVRFDSFDESDDTINICIEWENSFKRIMDFINIKKHDREKVEQFIVTAIESFDALAKEYGDIPEDYHTWDMDKVAKDLEWNEG